MRPAELALRSRRLHRGDQEGPGVKKLIAAVTREAQARGRKTTLRPAPISSSH